MDFHEGANRAANRFEGGPLPRAAPTGSPIVDTAGRMYDEGRDNEVVRLEQDEMVKTFYRASHEQYRSRKEQRQRDFMVEQRHNAIVLGASVGPNAMGASNETSSGRKREPNAYLLGMPPPLAGTPVSASGRNTPAGARGSGRSLADINVDVASDGSPLFGLDFLQQSPPIWSRSPNAGKMSNGSPLKSGSPGKLSQSPGKLPLYAHLEEEAHELIDSLEGGALDGG